MPIMSKKVHNLERKYLNNDQFHTGILLISKE
uniref:Uncharacterized protein n=1 Tax=Rhizophora mucronata TaxID=61149 RepID=A0A2P2M4G0_RHIMU